MNVINKQKFLAELAKLLTFMYEEDRQRALGAYSDMFEEAEDEQALLQALVSPLRQAVEVARAYNAGKPALDAKKLDDGDGDSHFMETIYRIRAEAFKKQEEPEVVYENQISLFDGPVEPAEEESPEEEEAAEAEEPSGEEAEPEEETEGEAPAEEAAEAEEESAGEAPVPEEAPAPAEEKRPEPVPEKSVPEKAVPEKSVPEKAEPERLAVQKTVRRPRILLLILYILIAVPLTLVGVLLLLIPAIASLAVSAACILVAVFGVMSAFGSFPKIANLLVALGVALILFALGLLFLMLFIWFLFGAIGGLIGGVIALGGKWCFKEVAAA